MLDIITKKIYTVISSLPQSEDAMTCFFWLRRRSDPYKEAGLSFGEARMVSTAVRSWTSKTEEPSQPTLVAEQSAT